MKSKTQVALNLDQLNAAKLIVPLSPRVRLALIGCGGTVTCEKEIVGDPTSAVERLEKIL